MVESGTETRQGVDVLPGGSEDGDPVLAGLVLVEIDGTDAYDGILVDGEEHLVEASTQLSVLETKEGVAVVGLKRVISDG